MSAFMDAFKNAISRNTDAAQQLEYKRIFEQSANSEQGRMQQKQAETPLNRWRNQIQAMMTSANPNVRDTGIGMLSQYQNKITNQSSESGPFGGDSLLNRLWMGGDEQGQFSNVDDPRFRKTIRDYSFKKPYKEDTPLVDRLIPDQVVEALGMDRKTNWLDMGDGKMPEPLNDVSKAAKQMAGLSTSFDTLNAQYNALEDKGFGGQGAVSQFIEFAGLPTSVSDMARTGQQQIGKALEDELSAILVKAMSGDAFNQTELRTHGNALFKSKYATKEAKEFAKSMRESMGDMLRGMASGALREEDAAKAISKGLRHIEKLESKSRDMHNRDKHPDVNPNYKWVD